MQFLCRKQASLRLLYQTPTGLATIHLDIYFRQAQNDGNSLSDEELKELEDYISEKRKEREK